MSELKKINGPVNIVGEVEATSLDINGNADISGNTVAGGQLTLDQDQITTNIGTTSAISLRPGATTNTTGKSSIFLGTSTDDNYGISLRGARLGTNGVPTFEIGTHSNSANGASTFVLDAGTLTLDTNMGTAGNFDGAQIRLDSLNVANSTGFQGMRFATSTTANYGWSMGANRRTDGRGSLRFYEHAGSNAGTERFTLLEDGNVGIGTASPNSKLEIKLGTNQNIGFNSHSSVARISSYNDAFSASSPLKINGSDLRFDISSVEKMRITSSGNVGIGTTSPGANLDVANGNAAGDAALDFPVIRLTNTTASSDWDVGDKVGVLEYYTKDTSGNAPYVASFINSVNETGNGSLSSGALVFGTATYNASGGAVERMRIDSSGNVGIGVVAPASKLHIAGTVQVGVDDAGHDVKFFGATSGKHLLWDESANRLLFTDNTYLALGAGDDVLMYHDGSNSHINNYTGNLTILNAQVDGDLILSCDDGSGGETAYLTLDGSATNIKVAKDIVFADSVDAHFGTGNDLQLLHNGTNSYIQNYTGDLYINNWADNRDIILQSDDGSGGVKAYLTLDGSTVTSVFSTDVTVEGDINVGSFLATGNSRLNLLSEAEHDTSIGFFEDNANLGFTFTYDGSANTFLIRRHNNSSGGSAVVTLNRSSDAVVFAGTIGSGAITSTGQITGTELEGTSLDINGNADISGNISFGDSHFIGDDANDNLLIQGSAGEALIIDSAGDIFLDAGGGDVVFKDDGTEFGKITNASGSLIIRNDTADKDIILKADNGAGTAVTYFSLDGSLATHDGSATTALHTKFPDKSYINLGNGSDFQMHHNGVDTILGNQTGDLKIRQFANDKDILFVCDNGSGGVATYLTLDGSDVNMKVAKDMVFADSVDASFGTGSDLKIHHDGSNSYISNHSGGHLYIQQNLDDKDIVLQCDDGSGGTTAYLTLDGGEGHLKVQKEMNFEDSVRATFGNLAGGDMAIYHDGTNNYHNHYTGDVYFRNNADDSDIIFQSDDGAGGVATYFSLDGSAAIHNGSATTALYTQFPDKSRISLGSGNDTFMTHSGTNFTMANTTGHMYFTQGTDDGDMVFLCDNGSGGTTGYLTLDGGLGYTTAHKHIRFNDSVQALFGTGSDLKIYHDGTHSYIDDTGTGRLRFKSSTQIDFLGANNESMANMIENGAVKLYHNNVKKFETTTAGATIVGTLLTSHIQTPDTSGSSFELFDSDGDTCLNISSKASAGDMTIEIGDTSEAGNSAKLVIDDGNAKVSIVNAELQLAGRITAKQREVYTQSFHDDLGTVKHYLPWSGTLESSANQYQEEVAMIAPCGGRIVSCTLRTNSLTGTSCNMTIGIQTRAAGELVGSGWVSEEEEVIAVSNASDNHVFHFVFSNAKHFEAGELITTCIQNSADLSGATYWWVSTVVEWDWNDLLGTSSGEHD